MKQTYIIVIFLIFYTCCKCEVGDINDNERNDNGINLDELLKDDAKINKKNENKIIDHQLENNVKTYQKDPQAFLSTHNNKDNFITLFTKYTKLNSESLYNQYISNKNNRGLQAEIDKINNINNRHLDSWEFNQQEGKFILPDNSII